MEVVLYQSRQREPLRPTKSGKKELKRFEKKVLTSSR